MTQELIQEGAEAKIFKKIEGDATTIIKQRINKKYRIEAINKLLIPSRTRREVKVMNKLNVLGVNVPKIIFTNKKDIIEMDFIQGEKIRDVLDNNVKLAENIGEILVILHDNNIIHGDLTTSNMLLNNNEIYFIDFGLSLFSRRLEDKAVDIHLFKQALESKHHKISEQAYKLFLKGYKKSKDHNEVMKRLKKVESRGRNINKE
jgi:Kae1-associated kinase Bud32